jgi:ribosomal-protein-alanine N-acetyltransferase
MIVIRPMQQDDVEGVMIIENAVCDFPWTDTIFSDCIKVGYSCWVLSENNEVLGYGLLSVSAGEGHILNLCIKPSHYRLGLGTRMMKHLIKQGKYLKADSVYLEARISNQKAIDLYHKLGFIQIGERLDYYPAKDGREDAYVLSLSLKEPIE